ncbi:hypothetical protein ESY86_20355 [Subsaximicrobium wynnwilliamsii]|uniref:Uncharacterized protein n=1 Tax=Subsaximicrobium wynnwilliamsii TaxID=291179 RepID=A0A5C6ZAX9_9FLAO|nr:hypothetical protein [Subsaximicrobium wynnwilliamsii]TXD80628.1 hypothetical protein ESY87_20505 [Subsaximicrobium wynnwilliamsii]TXD86359.1 hypothetical protein ESY86_20355 [Subsaximicrobium wynnwilliamsii]TXD99740.1 hypothetical protein ESY88_20450 [Subsaximicrobium wynnwilliamsii]
MKIRYKKKRLNYYLIFGVLWTVLGSLSIISHSNIILNYGSLILGVLFFGKYYFMTNRQYLTIENGIISKNQLIPKKINLNEVKVIKKLSGDYILQTDSAELEIDTELIEENSLSVLNALLKNLNLETK